MSRNTTLDVRDYGRFTEPEPATETEHQRTSIVGGTSTPPSQWAASSVATARASPLFCVICNA
jgi:hypothetical protein